VNNTTIQLKIKERLNKLDSNDYDNIEVWQFIEAFNKGQSAWCRRNLHGTNQTREGDEGSKRRIDDLQILLITDPSATVIDKGVYVEVTGGIPAEYMEWKRIDVYATNSCCPDKRSMVTYLAEEGNVAQLLRDYNKKPNFAWAETFATLSNNNINVYTNNEFTIENVILTYYRQPVRIQIQGVVDPYTLVVSPISVECEFKDDLAELFCDEAAKIIAGDLENSSQMQINSSSIEQNN